MYIAPRHIGWLAGITIFVLSACGAQEQLTKEAEEVSVYCNDELIMSGKSGLVKKDGSEIQLYTDSSISTIKQIYVMKPGDNCKVTRA